MVVRSGWRRTAAVYGLPILTAALGILGTTLGILSVPLGAAIAVMGAILVAAFDVVGRVRAEADRAGAERRALDRVSAAAERFHDRLASGMPLGGTSVPSGTTHERLSYVVAMLGQGRFSFLPGRRWSDWAWLGTTLEEGRQETLNAVGLTGGRLPTHEEQRVRDLAGLVESAAKHAHELASMYAGYDVTEKPARPRYMPEDRDVDVTGLPAYSDFAREFANVINELKRMAGLGSGT